MGMYISFEIKLFKLKYSANYYLGTKLPINMLAVNDESLKASSKNKFEWIAANRRKLMIPPTYCYSMN